MEEDKNSKMLIPEIVAVVILTLILVIAAFQKEPVSSSFKVSTKKATKDSSGVDWSKAKTFDINLASGSVSISQGGVYYVSGTVRNGSIMISSDEDIKLVLQDVKIKTKDSPAIYVKQAKNTYIELVGDTIIDATTKVTLDSAIYSKDNLYMYGDGSLTITSNNDGIASKDNLYLLSGTYNITSGKDGIKGKDSIEIKDGTYTIDAKEDGIKTTNEEDYGDITIEKGTFKITSQMDGIQSQNALKIKDGKYTIVAGGATDPEESQKGLKAIQDITIKGGEYNLSSVDDSIHSNSNITIEKGIYNISSNDDGIHADSKVTIKAGTINISKAYEGIEGYKININGGDIKIITSDDGINIGGGIDTSGMNNGRPDAFDQDNGGLLTITGGKLYINSTGDGLDSNGSIKMTGGVVHVDGPTRNNNGAVDYNGTFVITGGELIAVGSSGMSQNATDGTTQNTVLVFLSSAVTGNITLGEITYSPLKEYQSVLISSPKLQLNQDYNCQTGSTSTTVNLKSTVYTAGRGGMIIGGNRGGDFKPTNHGR